MSFLLKKGFLVIRKNAIRGGRFLVFLLFDSGMGEGFFREKIQLLSYICVCFIVWYGAGISIGGVGCAVGCVPGTSWEMII